MEQRLNLRKKIFLFLASIILSSFLALASANANEPLTIAVTSNALAPIKKIVVAFKAAHQIDVSIVSGSTGKLFTQITHGAPFDVFIAADELRPQLLEKRGLTKENSRFTYAVGVLAVWAQEKKELIKVGSTLDVLTDPKVRRIAIANPDIAPYGSAAIEALTSAKILKKVEDKFIYGENVSHAFNFARTGNADATITALSTLKGQSGNHIIIDSALHSPIIQQAVITEKAPASATKFMVFLKGTKGRAILKSYGYKLPKTTK
jgi:molybdate transport system substrate-binding protein